MVKSIDDKGFIRFVTLEGMVCSLPSITSV